MTPVAIFNKLVGPENERLLFCEMLVQANRKCMAKLEEKILENMRFLNVDVFVRKKSSLEMLLGAMLVGLFFTLVALQPDHIFWRNFHLKLTNLFYII